MDEYFANLRVDYVGTPILERKSDLPEEPWSLFKEWFECAATNGVREPNGMTLSTLSKDGYPASRTVLLKEWSSKSGFTFYTNLESQKGLELLDNSKVALLFWWRELYRQVRIVGDATQVSDEEADKYFASRPFEAQIAASISPQSQEISSRLELISLYESELTRARSLGREVKRPAFWGGFTVKPLKFEFWQGMTSRLHDRLLFKILADGRWDRKTLAP
jgi:pyridoxamine 5'-phosphate oxidase